MPQERRPRNRLTAPARALILFSWLGVTTTASDGLAAQELRGRVFAEEVGGQPVEGALVALNSPTDVRVDAAFSNGDGSFRLVAPQSGSFFVTIERIGFATWTSGPLELESDEARAEVFAIPILPVRLAEIDVAIHRGCEVDPRREAQLYAVWDEARKALQAALLAQRDELLRFNSMTFDRVLLQRPLEFEDVRTLATHGTPETPFQSLPAEDLARDGYIQEEGGAIVFYAPDAEVLLSDTFLGGHCFGLDRDRIEGRELVGLTFEPLEDADVPDIKGVLWVDETSAELDHVAFEYTSIPYRGVEDDQVGGRIDFRRLPTGAFVVDDWFIRMPVMLQTARDQRRDRYSVVGFTEHGGELRDVFVPEGEPVSWVRGGSIRGQITDPISGEPLGNATIRLDRPRGHDIARHTDPEGRFIFDNLDAGKHELELSHGILEGLDWRRPKVEVELAEGAQNEIVFDLPDPLEVIERECGRGSPGGAVVGRVFHDENLFPKRGSRIRAEWNVRTGAEAAGEPASGPTVQGEEVRSDREGRYALCELPLDQEIDVYLEDGDVFRHARIPADRLVVLLDFVLGSPRSR